MPTRETTQLDDFAADYLKKSGTTTGEQLYEILEKKFPYLTQDNFADLVQRLVRRGKIDVYEQVRAISLQHYLATWEKSLWFYVSIIASVSSALTAYVLPLDSPFLALRWILGLLFVLFLPGYAALQALFPAAELDGLDRVILSIAVSIILDMLSGLVLNFSPWGIRLVPILLLLGAETLCLSSVAVVRQIEASRAGSQIITIT